MEDEALRQQLADAARQLWTRSLLHGANGLVTLEARRRRYLAPRTGDRRATLDPHRLIQVDLDGHAPEDPAHDLPPALWLPHKLAYQATANHPPTPTNPPPGTRDPRITTATALVQPPSVLALAQLQPDTTQPIELPGRAPIPIIDPENHAVLEDALAEGRAVMLKDQGLFLAAPSLDRLLNRAETLEAAARLDLLTR
ncbi:MAG: class II aldolase/adducin family protein [Planctomycetota bacterium]